MTHHTAIVLNHVTDARFRVFSDKYGLHDITYRVRAANYLIRGAVIQCVGAWRGARYVAHSAGMQHQPARWALHDIWFLHHVIDILLSCLCYAQPDRDVFALLEHLYTSISGDYREIQALFLARLFFLLGVQPENVLRLQPLMRYIAVHTFTQLLTYNQYAYDDVCEWLVSCSRVCDIYRPLRTQSFYTVRGKK